MVINYKEHESIKIRPNAPEAPDTILKVIGIGGAGGNAINRMIEANLSGVEFVAMNTDSQVLKTCRAPYRLLLGQNLTGGLGAGGRPDVGRKSANEERDGIINALQGAKMVFITAGMGGGTGTGAAPVVAELSKELGILTVGVVSRPFKFEGPKRAQQAAEGLDELKTHVDTLITIPNDKILEFADEKMYINDAFARADDTLRQAVQGVSSIIVDEGIINVDFADVKSVMSARGEALMGVGLASGDDRAVRAVQEAMRNPLTDNYTIAGASAVLVWVRGGVDMTLKEFQIVSEAVQNEAGGKCDVFVGYGQDEALVDQLQVVLVAAGIERNASSAVRRATAGGQIQARAAQAPAGAGNGDSRMFTKRADVAGESLHVQGNAQRPEFSEDDLQVPTFIRRAQGQ